MILLSYCWEKLKSHIGYRYKATIEHISGRQPSPFELVFGVELGPNLHSKPMDNFLQHSPMSGLKDTNRRWKIWWIAATTSIWKLRNDIIFNNHPFVISRLLDNTIFLSWSWMRGWEKDFNVPFHQWSSSMALAFK